MKNSLKQLLRRPGKAVLFFLLLAAATLLLTFGAALFVQTTQRMEALKGLYHTIATVSQPAEAVEYISDVNDCHLTGKIEYTGEIKWLDDVHFTMETQHVQSHISFDYGEIITPQQLMFPGADYVVPPENRPYFLAYLPDTNNGTYYRADTFDMVEFQVTEGSTAGVPAKGIITKIVFNGNARMVHEVTGWEYQNNIEVGQEITVCQHLQEGAIPLENGHTYIGYLREDYCEVHDQLEQWPVGAPYTSRVDAQAHPIESGYFPAGLSGGTARLEEVTEGFYEEGGHGQDWLNYAEAVQRTDHMYGLLAVNDAELLKCYRNNNMHIRGSGRMITPEEFASGAKVCMISDTLAQRQLWYEGNKIRLPLTAAVYGVEGGNGWGGSKRCTDYGSLLDENGKLLEPFWEEEYEIVGVFNTGYGNDDLPFSSMFIIPWKSVGASDENNIIYYGPMQELNAGFQIPNGTIDSFMAGLKENVPQADRLDIQFSDNGFTQMMDSMKESQNSALLLLAVGGLAAVSILMLLLYFFVVMEKKRTAIERSLGLTKRQCRVSIMAGLMVLTLGATVAGSVAAGVLLENQQAMELSEAAAEREAQAKSLEQTSVVDWSLGGVYNFSAKFSPWAMWDINGNQNELETIMPPLWIYGAVPLALTLLVALLALVNVNQNLKIEPILLLNTKA